MNGSELEVWRGAWKTLDAGEPVRAAFDIRREAMRQQRSLRGRYILGFVWAAALLVFSVIAVQRNWQTSVWAAVVWLTTFIALGFTVWNWRTVWRDEAASISEFASLYQKRCEAELRGVRFGYYFLGLQLSIVVPWRSWDFYRSGLSGSFGLRPYSIAMGATLLLTLVFLYFFERTRRKTEAELEQLREFRRSSID